MRICQRVVFLKCCKGFSFPKLRNQKIAIYYPYHFRKKKGGYILSIESSFFFFLAKEFTF